MKFFILFYKVRENKVFSMFLLKFKSLCFLIACFHACIWDRGHVQDFDNFVIKMFVFFGLFVFVKL
jgi:hypothetical protein